MNVYGEMLAFFPELKRPIIFFTMQPGVLAGYENRAGQVIIDAIYMPMKAKDIGYEGDTLSAKIVQTVWTEVKLVENVFARVYEKDYRVVNIGKPFGYEGNFNVYVLENLVGITDKQVKNEAVDLGKSDYA